MKRTGAAASLAIAAMLGAGTITLVAQAPSRRTGIDASALSSVPAPGDVGRRAHTNLRILVSSEAFDGPAQAYGPPFSGRLYQTPASIACIYRLQRAVPGCNPNVVSKNP